MSRKHYVALANALKDGGAERGIVLAIAAVLKEDNVRFDLHRFMKAAGHAAVVNVAQHAAAQAEKDVLAS